MKISTNKRLYPIVLVLFAIVLFSSCVNKNKLTYMHKSDSKNLKSSYYNEPEPYRLKPHDDLFIKVLSHEEKTKELFRIEYSGLSGENNALMYYELNDSGYVDIPFVGEVFLKDLTLQEAKKKLELDMSQYIDQFAIQVKLANMRVVVLGEVNTPGTYAYFKEPMTLFQAIGMAGGLTQWGDRKEIILIREQENVVSEIKIDLTRKDFVGSKYYYIRPDDQIFVNPVDAKFNTMGQFNYGTVLSTITTLITLMYFFIATR